MFQNMTVYIFKYFSLCGFHSMPSMRIGGKYVRFIILLGYFAVCSWWFFSSLKTFSGLLIFMDYLDALNITLYNMTCIVTFSLIIYDSCVKQNAQNAFGRSLIEANLKYFPEMPILNWNYIITLILLLIGASLDFVYAVILYDEFNQIHHNFIQYLIFTVYDNRIFFYVLHLRVILVQLRKIQSELRLMQEQTFDHYKLKWAQDYYKLIYEMCEYVNEMFGMSNLALILSTFHTSVTLLNSAFRSSQKRFDLLNYGSCFCIIMLIS